MFLEEVIRESLTMESCPSVQKWALPLVAGGRSSVLCPQATEMLLVTMVGGFLALALTLPQILYYFLAQQDYPDPLELKAQTNTVIIFVSWLEK